MAALAFVCPVSAAALLAYRENGAAAVAALLGSRLVGPESAFLLKPFPPDALIACARSLLDKARIR